MWWLYQLESFENSWFKLPCEADEAWERWSDEDSPPRFCWKVPGISPAPSPQLWQTRHVHSAQTWHMHFNGLRHRWTNRICMSVIYRITDMHNKYALFCTFTVTHSASPLFIIYLALLLPHNVHHPSSAGRWTFMHEHFHNGELPFHSYGDTVLNQNKNIVPLLFLPASASYSKSFYSVKHRYTSV